MSEPVPEPLQLVDDRVRQANLEAAEREQKLHDALSGSEATNQLLGRKVAQLEGELTKAREASPEAQDIRAILDRWVQKCRPRCSVDPKTPSGGKRWDYAKRGRRAFELAECFEAVDGAALAPYLVFGSRRAGGRPEDHRNDVEHIFGSEARTEECIRVARYARALPEDVLYDRWQRLSAVEQMYFLEWSEARATRR